MAQVGWRGYSWCQEPVEGGPARNTIGNILGVAAEVHSPDVQEVDATAVVGQLGHETSYQDGYAAASGGGGDPGDIDFETGSPVRGVSMQAQG